MTLWIALTALVAFSCGLLAPPFLRRLATVSAPGGAARFAAGQIAEVEADVTRGAIDPAEAEAARAEIGRRLLRAQREGEAVLGEGGPVFRLAALAILCGWVVVASVLIYGVVGRPELGAVVAAPGPEAPQLASGGVDVAIAALAARLQEDPRDAEGWRMLGWSYFKTENYAASVEAYQRAVALDGSNPVIFSVLGEAMVRADGGAVTDRALSVFHQALALDPRDARARFFQGLALEQQGDKEGALRLWTDILDRAPADADWAPGLRTRVAELAAATGAEIPVAPGPTAGDVAAASAMSEDDRAAMIRGMVDRLAARLEDDPSDADGWIRLLRSYVVLQDLPAARAALVRARNAVATEARAQIDGAARDMGLE